MNYYRKMSNIIESVFRIKPLQSNLIKESHLNANQKSEVVDPSFSESQRPASQTGFQQNPILFGINGKRIVEKP